MYQAKKILKLMNPPVQGADGISTLDAQLRYARSMYIKHPDMREMYGEDGWDYVMHDPAVMRMLTVLVKFV